MSIIARAIAIGEAVAEQGFMDAREGKAPAGADYFADQTARILPVVSDRVLLQVSVDGLRENYMIGYEGGKRNG